MAYLVGSHFQMSTDLWVYTTKDLLAVAVQLNSRPRKPSIGTPLPNTVNRQIIWPLIATLSGRCHDDPPF